MFRCARDNKSSQKVTALGALTGERQKTKHAMIGKKIRSVKDVLNLFIRADILRSLQLIQFADRDD